MTTIRLTILIVTYLLIAVQRVPFRRLNRPAAALLGAVAIVTIGGLPLHDAYAAIDLDVIVFLLGVLLITGFLEAGGFFEWSAQHVCVRLARRLACRTFSAPRRDYRGCNPVRDLSTRSGGGVRQSRMAVAAVL
ncbi:MAG: SLC13 family permease [Gemmatimonadaceae bacterium]